MCGKVEIDMEIPIAKDDFVFTNDGICERRTERLRMNGLDIVTSSIGADEVDIGSFVGRREPYTC